MNDKVLSVATQEKKLDSLLRETRLGEVFDILKDILPLFIAPISHNSRGEAGVAEIGLGTGFGHGSGAGGGVKVYGKDYSAAGGAVSYNKQMDDIRKEINTKEKRKEVLLAPYGLAAPPAKIATELQQLEDSIVTLTTKLDSIITEGLLLSSRQNKTRSNLTSFKINENEYYINKAIESLKAGTTTPYQITLSDGSLFDITTFQDLRNYIIEHTNDPVTLLLKLTGLNPIHLDDMLPSIIEDTFTIKTNDKGILQVQDINEEIVEMPNPLGNKNNRKEFSKKI